MSKEKEFYTIIEMVQIPYLNTEAMIRSDGMVFIKLSDKKYYDKATFFKDFDNFNDEFIKYRTDLFDSITKYAKEKYNL